MAKQILLPKSSSPNIDTDQLGSMEWLEITTDNDIDIRDFSERPANEKRPAKPPRKPRITLQNLIPPPGCPNYMAMNVAAVGIPKPHNTETRGIIPKKKKVPRGWPVCLKRLLPKVMFQNNNIYSTLMDDSNHHNEEPQEKNKEGDHILKEKNT